MHTAGKKVELDIGCEPKCGPADVTAECVRCCTVGSVLMSAP